MNWGNSKFAFWRRHQSIMNQQDIINDNDNQQNINNNYNNLSYQQNIDEIIEDKQEEK